MEQQSSSSSQDFGSSAQSNDPSTDAFNLATGTSDVSSTASNNLCILCRRLWKQRDPWIQHYKKYSHGTILGMSCFIPAVILTILRCIFPVYLEFSIPATCLFIIFFTFYWVAIPRGPPFLASTDLEPQYN